MHLDELELKLQKLKPYPDQLKVGAELVLDVDKMVKSHVKVLRAQSGNRLFKPYYDRLLEVYQILSEGE